MYVGSSATLTLARSAIRALVIMCINAVHLLWQSGPKEWTVKMVSRAAHLEVVLTTTTR